jgi:hypothetical protein
MVLEVDKTQYPQRVLSNFYPFFGTLGTFGSFRKSTEPFPGVLQTSFFFRVRLESKCLRSNCHWRVTVVGEQVSGEQLSLGNKCRESKCPGSKCRGSNCPESKCRGSNCPGCTSHGFQLFTSIVFLSAFLR